MHLLCCQMLTGSHSILFDGQILTWFIRKRNSVNLEWLNVKLFILLAILHEWNVFPWIPKDMRTQTWRWITSVRMMLLVARALRGRARASDFEHLLNHVTYIQHMSYTWTLTLGPSVGLAHFLVCYVVRCRGGSCTHVRTLKAYGTMSQKASPNSSNIAS